MQLSLQDLAALTCGHLRLARMPPRDGELALVQRLVLDAEDASEGSVYWCFDGRQCAAELAYLRGAGGVVAAHAIEPWPGRFSLLVANPLDALERVVGALVGWDQRAQLAPAHHHALETTTNLPELKGLQLCAGGGVDIYSPTCCRPANQPALRRCRRRAA